jgi:hypothetical protein
VRGAGGLTRCAEVSRRAARVFPGAPGRACLSSAVGGCRRLSAAEGTLVMMRSAGGGGMAGLRRAVVTALAGLAVFAVAGGGLASASTRAAVARVNWGIAVEVPGTAALNAGGDAQVLAVSCWRAEACAAGGFYADAAGRQQAFVVTAAGGVWGDAQPVPGLSRLNAGGAARVLSVACPRDGDCAAGGFYTDAHGHQQAFVASLAGGQWGQAVELRGTGKLNAGGSAQVIALSCPAAGGCAAAGDYRGSVTGASAAQAFVASEHAGRWAAAEQVPGLAGGNLARLTSAAMTSLSCPSAGNCAAGGWWLRNGNRHGFVASLTRGRWGRLVSLRGGGPVSSVSCWRAGDCLAGGTSGGASHNGYVATQIRGRWTRTDNLAVLRGDTVSSVSCPSAGNCAVAGLYPSSPVWGPTSTYVMNQRGGIWPRSVYITQGGDAATSGDLIEVSCSSAGNCGAAGAYLIFAGLGGYFNVAFQVGERGRRWERANWPPSNNLIDVGLGPSQANSVSCPTAGTCVAAGYYTTCPSPEIGNVCQIPGGKTAPDTTTQAWIDEQALAP